MAHPRIGRSRLLELLGDMSQTEFARRIGVSDSFITQVIKGKTMFSYEKAKHAADVLGVQMEELVEWTYEQDPKSKRPE